MEKINIGEIRSKYATDDGKGAISAGDDTLKSMVLIAKKVNEIIDERLYDADSVRIWNETIALALDLHRTASWGQILMEIGRLKALVSVGFAKTERGRVVLGDTDNHTNTTLD